jgi:aryl-alcohol dehydrogenase-like predicted oxidoreductase
MLAGSQQMTPAEAGKTLQRATLGRTGLRVGRLGVAASYGVPAAAVERAFEQGVNYFYWGTFRHGGFGEAIRHLAPQRDRFILVIQSYARIAGLMGWSVERALRALRLDHADVLLLGLWNKPVPARIIGMGVSLASLPSAGNKRRGRLQDRPGLLDERTQAAHRQLFIDFLDQRGS